MTYVPRRYEDATPGKPYNRCREVKIHDMVVMKFDFSPWLNYIVCDKCGENAADYGRERCSACLLIEQARFMGEEMARKREEMVLRVLAGGNP